MRSTLQRTFDDISSSWNMFWERLLVITLSSKDFSRRGDVMGLISRRGLLFTDFSMMSPRLETCFQTTPSWLFSKHFVGREDVVKRCIKTRSILQITRWYFPVLKYVLRTTPRDYFFFERFLRTRRCHGKTYQEEKYTSKEIGWRKIVVEWLLKRNCHKKIHRHG